MPNVTIKQLRAIMRDAYDQGVSAMQNADRPKDIIAWRAEYVRDTIQLLKENSDDSGRKARRA